MTADRPALPVHAAATTAAALIIRLDLDPDGANLQRFMSAVNALLPDGADAWIGINEYAERVDALLVEFGRPPTTARRGPEKVNDHG